MPNEFLIPTDSGELIVSDLQFDLAIGRDEILLTSNINETAYYLIGMAGYQDTRLALADLSRMVSGEGPATHQF